MVSESPGSLLDNPLSGTRAERREPRESKPAHAIRDMGNLQRRPLSPQQFLIHGPATMQD